MSKVEWVLQLIVLKGCICVQRSGFKRTLQAILKIVWSALDRVWHRFVFNWSVLIYTPRGVSLSVLLGSIG